MKTRVPIILVGIVLWLAAPAAGWAAIPIASWGEEEEYGLELSGYARTFTGASHLYWLDAEDVPEPVRQAGGDIPDVSGLSAEVIRLQWQAAVSEVLTLELHNEFFFQVSNAGGGGIGNSGAYGQLGLSSSRQPDRTVDLRSEILDENGLRFTHDIDRLAAHIYTDVADITVGRQGITWGKSMIFPVADLWSRFSPFELDTEQKPGIDAVRALFYPSLSSEIDVVIADRGSLEDLSGGVRGSFTVGKFDLMFAGGKFWEELMALAGASVVVGKTKMRAEAVLPWDLEDSELQLPRATAGVEYFSPSVVFGAEYHFNGTGAAQAEDYVEQAGSEEFLRGESYFLGRHYLGLFTSYTGVDRLTLGLSAIGNLLDPSVVAVPTVRYEIAQNTTIGIGSYVGIGEEPAFRMVSMPPGMETSLGSEFGTFGAFYFAELAAYF